MKINKGSKVILRKEYVTYYENKSELKLSNSIGTITEIDDSSFLPFTVIDSDNNTHKLGYEDFDKKATKRLSLKLRLKSIKNYIYGF